MLQECKVRRNRKVWYMQSYEVAQGIERSDMIYTIGQLQTLIDFAKSRGIRLVNLQFPPSEVCRRIRNKPRIGWCTLLRGPCKCDTNGCLRMEVRETKGATNENT